jgi:hypothetical protein
MQKKQSLSEALQHSMSGGAPTSVPEQASGRAPMSPSRHGKKTIAGHFDPAVSRQLREIALAEDSSVQELLREALNDLFTKRGKPPIA